MDSAFRKCYELTFQVWVLSWTRCQRVKTNVRDYNFLVVHDEPLRLWHYIYSVLGSDWYIDWRVTQFIVGQVSRAKDSWWSSFEFCQQLESHQYSNMKNSPSFIWVTVIMFFGNKYMTTHCKSEKKYFLVWPLLLCLETSRFLDLISPN